jgi:predicted SnoaL-like aldol condensation-catalyzing enzyme
METTLKKNAAPIAVLSTGIGILLIASFASLTNLDLANAQQNKTLIQNNSIEEKNKALVLKAFDTLFNKRDYVAAEHYWSPNYIQHSTHIEPGREGLFNLVKSSPPTLKYEPGIIVADGDFVIVHGRFSGRGQPVNWIAADILRIEDGLLVEHWDVIQDEATQEQSKSGMPMFGDKFPNTSGSTK